MRFLKTKKQKLITGTLATTAILIFIAVLISMGSGIFDKSQPRDDITDIINTTDTEEKLPHFTDTTTLPHSPLTGPDLLFNKRMRFRSLDYAFTAYAQAMHPDLSLESIKMMYSNSTERLTQQTNPSVYGFFSIAQIVFSDESRENVLLIGIEERISVTPTRVDESYRICGTKTLDLDRYTLPTRQEYYDILARDSEYGEKFKEQFTTLPETYTNSQTLDYSRLLEQAGHIYGGNATYDYYVKYVEISDNILAVIAPERLEFRDDKILPFNYFVRFIDTERKELLDVCIALDNFDHNVYSDLRAYYSKSDQSLYIIKGDYDDYVFRQFLVFTIPLPDGDVGQLQSATIKPKATDFHPPSFINKKDIYREIYSQESAHYTAEHRDDTLYIKNKATGTEEALFIGKTGHVNLIDVVGTKLFGFIDDKYLIYNIFGHERFRGYGIYNTETGKNVICDDAHTTLFSVYNGIAYCKSENTDENGKNQIVISAIDLETPEVQIPLHSVLSGTFFFDFYISNDILYIAGPQNNFFMDISDYSKDAPIPDLVTLEPSSATFRSASKDLYLSYDGVFYIK